MARQREMEKANIESTHFDEGLRDQERKAEKLQ